MSKKFPLGNNVFYGIFALGRNGKETKFDSKEPSILLESTITADIHAFLDTFISEEDIKKKEYELFPTVVEAAKATGKSFSELFANSLKLIKDEQTLVVHVKSKIQYEQNEYDERTTCDENGNFIPPDRGIGVAFDVRGLASEYGININSYSYEVNDTIDITLKYNFAIDFKRFGVNLYHFYELNSIPVVNLLHNLELAIDRGDKYIWEKIYYNGKQCGGKMRLNVKNNGDNLDKVFDENYKKSGARAGLKDVLSSLFFTTGGTSTWGEDIGDNYSEATYDCIFGIFTGFKSYRFDGLKWNKKPDTYKDLIDNLTADANSLKLQAKMMETAAEVVRDTCGIPANKLDPSKKLVYKDLLRAILKNAVMNDPISLANVAESDVPMTTYHQDTPYKYISSILVELAKSLVSGDSSDEG